MSKRYFNPGCALSLYKPETEQRVLRFLDRHLEDVTLHKICCRHDPQVEPGAVIINVCAGCDRRFRSLYEGVGTLSLWEVLDGLEGFAYPDYGGAQMSVHDPCPVRQRPQVHAAIRSLLGKMNIRVVEAEHHGVHSVCCGDDFYPTLPVADVHKKMKARAQSMPCQDVVVYCVSCVKSMHIGGKTPRHMIDLLFAEPTTPEPFDTQAWHAQLQAYIDAQGC